jgi:hypothetical protein
MTAEIRLGWTTVWPQPVVERAVEPALIEVAAGGNQLPPYRIGALTGQLAQVGGEAGADQRLQPGVRFRAEYFDLEITAAGRPPGMVCGGTGRDRTGIDAIEVIGEYREGAARVWHLAALHPPSLHHGEPIFSQPSRLRGDLGRRRDVVEAVRATGQSARPLTASGTVEVPASHMKSRINEEIVSDLAEIAKAHAFGVAEQPGRLVIAGPIIAVEGRDSEGGLKRMAVWTGGPAGRRRVHPTNLICCATPPFSAGSLCL